MHHLYWEMLVRPLQYGASQPKGSAGLGVRRQVLPTAAASKWMKVLPTVAASKWILDFPAPQPPSQTLPRSLVRRPARCARAQYCMAGAGLHIRAVLLCSFDSHSRQ